MPTTEFVIEHYRVQIRKRRGEKNTARIRGWEKLKLDDDGQHKVIVNFHPDGGDLPDNTVDYIEQENPLPPGVSHVDELSPNVYVELEMHLYYSQYPWVIDVLRNEKEVKVHIHYSEEFLRARMGPLVPMDGTIPSDARADTRDTSGEPNKSSLFIMNQEAGWAFFSRQ